MDPLCMCLMFLLACRIFMLKNLWCCLQKRWMLLTSEWKGKGQVAISIKVPDCPHSSLPEFVPAGHLWSLVQSSVRALKCFSVNIEGWLVIILLWSPKKGRKNGMMVKDGNFECLSSQWSCITSVPDPISEYSKLLAWLVSTAK